MIHLRNTTLALLALVVLAAPAAAGEGHDHSDHAKASHAKVGHMAPDFELTDHAGDVHRLSDYRGKVVVLEWTNPQCPFVVRHYQEDTMVDMASAHEDVVWLAVDSSHFVTAESASTWAGKEDISYPILLDASGEVGRMYQARTTPHMFVIGTDGTLLYDGAIDDDPRGKSDERTNYVAVALEAALAGEEPATVTTKPYGCSVKYAKTTDAQVGASR